MQYIILQVHYKNADHYDKHIFYLNENNIFIYLFIYLSKNINNYF